MKKTTRNILIMLAVLVVLGGAAALLLLTSPETDETSSAVSSTPTEEILKAEPAQIAAISVKNPEASFEIIPEEAKEEASSEEESGASADVTFTLKGYESYDVDTTQVSTSTRSLLTVNASKNLGQVEDLEPYGLSGDSAVTVDILYKDGGKDTLVIGGKAGETVGRYVLKDGTVYIAGSLSDQLLGSPMVFFSKEVYAVADRVEETTDDEGSASQTTVSDILYSMRLSGTDFDRPIEIKYNEARSSGYQITTPVVAESGSNKFNELVESLKSLTASSVAAAGLTEENLEQFGLKEPAAQLEFNMNGEDHVLKVSAKGSDGTRYLIGDEKETIFQVPGDQVEKWVEASLSDLRLGYVWLPNIMDVSKLSLTVEGDMVYACHMTRVKNEEKSTETKTAYDLTVKNADGKDIDYENYQDFYTKLLGVAVLSSDEAAYSGTPILRAEYEYFSGQDGDTIEFYALDGRDDRYVAVLNGQFNGLVRKSEVDSLLPLISKLNQNQSVEE